MTPPRYHVKKMLSESYETTPIRQFFTKLRKVFILSQPIFIVFLYGGGNLLIFCNINFKNISLRIVLLIKKGCAGKIDTAYCKTLFNKWLLHNFIHGIEYGCSAEIGTYGLLHPLIGSEAA